MPSKEFGPPLPDVVLDGDSGFVRCYVEHLEGLADWQVGFLTSTAGHIAVWLALSWVGLDKIDICLVDRKILHDCR